MTDLIQYFGPNQQGRDFVISDIHGYFSKVEEKLIEIGFDETKDRLFSVGDLIDRGPENLRVLDWLKKPWFYAVRGNHEQLLIDSFFGDQQAYEMHRKYGGAWFYALDSDDQKCYVDALNKLPYIIEIDKKYGIIHAEPPLDYWGMILARLSLYSNLRNACIWSTGRILHDIRNTIHGIDYVYCGHYRLDKPLQLGNIWFIETCVWHYSGYLTIIEIGKHHESDNSKRYSTA